MAASSSLPARRSAACCWRRCCSRERVPVSRVLGAVAIVGGLAVIGAESIGHIGADGVLGDLLFVLTGFMFAVLRHAVAALACLRLLGGHRHQRAVALAAAALCGLRRVRPRGGARPSVRTRCRRWRRASWPAPAALYLFAFSIQTIGVARAAMFPATVPALTILAGWLLLGEPPTALQAAGLVTVLCGFYLAQRQRA